MSDVVCIKLFCDHPGCDLSDMGDDSSSHKSFCGEMDEPYFTRNFVRRVLVEEEGVVAGDAGSVRVMTYNILEQHQPRFTPQCCEWVSRKRLIVAEMVEYDPDIICLQEAEPMQFESLLRDLGSAYTGKLNIGAKTHGVAILFKSAKFVLTDSRWLHLNKLLAPMKPGKGDTIGEGDVAFWDKMEATDCNALVLTLETVAHQKSVCVATTHLHWDPKFPEIRATQMAVLLETIFRDTIPPEGGSHRPPLLLCGDLNSMPHMPRDRFNPEAAPVGLLSGVYDLLRKGVLTGSHPHHPCKRREGVVSVPYFSNPFTLESAYVTVTGMEASGTLASIWSTPQLRARAVLLPPSTDALSAASDDISLVADYVFEHKILFE